MSGSTSPEAETIIRQQETINRLMGQSASQIERVQRNLDTAYAAQKRFETAQNSITSAVERGRISQERANQLLELAKQRHEAATQAMQRSALASQAFSTANDNAAGQARNFGGIVGQAGFQLQDFAVQVQGGTSALTALSQQGSQFLGAFGTVGAIAGAILTVGILASRFGQVESATDAAKRSTEAYATAVEKLRGLLESAAQAAHRLRMESIQTGRAAALSLAEVAQGRGIEIGEQVLRQQEVVDRMRQQLGTMPENARGGLVGRRLQANIAEAEGQLRTLQNRSEQVASEVRRSMDMVRQFDESEQRGGAPPGKPKPAPEEEARSRAGAAVRARVSPDMERDVMQAREALRLAQALAQAENPREAMLARQRAELERSTVALRSKITAETDPAVRSAMEEQIRLITKYKEEAQALEETTRNRNALFQQQQQLDEQRVRIQGLGMARGDAAALLAETQTRNRIISEGGDPTSAEALERIANAQELAFGEDRLAQVEEYRSAVSSIGSAFSSAADDIFTNGKKIGDVIASLERQILRMVMNLLVMKPLERGLSTLMGQLVPTTGTGAGGIEGLITRGGSSLFSALGLGGAGGTIMEKAGEGIIKAAIAHTGGIVGNDNLPTRILPASVFLDAPRYHSGGMAGGLRGDEVPAVLQRGEMVLTQAQQLAVGTALKGRAVVINQTIKTDDPGAFNRSSAQVARAGARGIQRAARSA
jgi:hypothetical protein